MLLKVDRVAQFLGVSARRVRVLLAQGRLSGLKTEGNVWQVFWPLDVRPGKRGPDLRHFPIRRITNPVKPSKGTRQGVVLPFPVKTAPSACTK
jgi:hypothetical protein